MASSTIFLRSMTPGDYDEVLAVARSLAAWFHPLDQMTLAVDLREHLGLVAIQAGHIVGFLTYHLLSEQAAELSWLGVAPAQQAQGVGSRLLRDLEERLRCRGVRTLQLSTVPADHDSHFATTNAFYLRHGFVIQRRDEHFYAYGRPRVLLKKWLALDTPSEGVKVVRE